MSTTVTRRAVLAAAPSATMMAFATGEGLPPLPRPAAETVPTMATWVPAGVIGTYVDKGADGLINLHLHFDDGTYRAATDDEFEGFLRDRPYYVEDVAPDFLRLRFADEDGELFALIAEMRLAWRREDTPAATIMQQICETPAVTDIGAAMQLHMLITGTYASCDPLPEHQLRQLAWSACTWLQQKWRSGKKIERREFDVADAARKLQYYRPENEARRAGAVS